MTRTDESVTMTPVEWVGHERALRKWKLITAIVASTLTILLAAGAWIRSDAEAQAFERIRRDNVSQRLETLEEQSRRQSRRLGTIERATCRILWLQGGEDPAYCRAL